MMVGDEDEDEEKTKIPAFGSAPSDDHSPNDHEIRISQRLKNNQNESMRKKYGTAKDVFFRNACIFFAIFLQKTFCKNKNRISNIFLQKKKLCKNKCLPVGPIRSAGSEHIPRDPVHNPWRPKNPLMKKNQIILKIILGVVVVTFRSIENSQRIGSGPWAP